MCILSWSGPVRRLLMALKSKMLRSSCRYTSTESTISTGQHRQDTVSPKWVLNQLATPPKILQIVQSWPTAFKQFIFNLQVYKSFLYQENVSGSHISIFNLINDGCVPFREPEPIQWANFHKSSLLMLFELNRTEPSTVPAAIKRSPVPLKGLNLFSRSNSCLPSLDRSIRRSGQMAYSSRVRLTWWIRSMTVSGEGPGQQQGIRCKKHFTHHDTGDCGPAECYSESFCTMWIQTVCRNLGLVLLTLHFAHRHYSCL